MGNANRRLHHTNVLRRSSAAAAYEPDSSGHELARIARHVLGRAEIDISSFDVPRHASVRHRGQRGSRHLPQPLDGIEHRHWTNTAIDANDISSPLGQPGTKV